MANLGDLVGTYRDKLHISVRRNLSFTRFNILSMFLLCLWRSLNVNVDLNCIVGLVLYFVSLLVLTKCLGT